MLQHRILYQVVEDGITTAGRTVGVEDVREYLVILRKRFRDATYIYCELEDSFEDDTDDEDLIGSP